MFLFLTISPLSEFKQTLIGVIFNFIDLLDSPILFE